MGSVTKSDREYWISWFKDVVNQRWEAYQQEHAEDFRHADQKARELVEKTDVGEDYLEYEFIDAQIDHMKERVNEIAKKHGLHYAFDMKSVYTKAVREKTEELLAEKGLTRAPFDLEIKAIQAQIMLATTDARLADSVERLMKILDIKTPEEELDENN
jgi:hypothetical protein